MGTHGHPKGNRKIIKKVMAQSCPGVARIFNLPYRRIAFCGSFEAANGSVTSNAQPIANRRYSRLQICATSFGSLFPDKTDPLRGRPDLACPFRAQQTFDLAHRGRCPRLRWWQPFRLPRNKQMNERRANHTQSLNSRPRAANSP